MYRVVTDIRDHRQNRLLERGPWHPHRDDAERWADILGAMGYKVKIEKMHGAISETAHDDDLAAALSSMA